MSDPDNDASTNLAVEAAVNLRAQQHNQWLNKYHRHTLLLEDMFCTAIRAGSIEYDLSAELMRAVGATSSTVAVEGAQSRFTKLNTVVEESAAELLQSLNESCNSLRAHLQEVIANAARDYQAKDRARANTLIEVTSVCRREVSAFIGMIKSEHICTDLEVQSLSSLQQALATKAGQVQTLRRQLDEVNAQRENERLKFRTELDDERTKARQTLHDERMALSSKLNDAMQTMDNERSKQASEVAALCDKHLKTVATLRSQLNERTLEAESLRDDVDRARAEVQREQRQSLEERNRLLQTISKSEMQLEALKGDVQAAKADSTVAAFQYEHFVETRKLVELDYFKRKIAESASSTFAYPSGALNPTTNTVATGAQSFSTRSRTPALDSQPHASASVLAQLSASPAPFRSSSSLALAGNETRTPRGVSLRSPSDTFVKLSSISNTLRDQLARASSPGI